MILSSETQERIVKAAHDEVHAVMGGREKAVSPELMERAIALATIKHTVNALHQPCQKERRETANAA